MHNYNPEEADKYVAYPELMESTVAYARRELVRLERLGDCEMLWKGGIGQEGEGIEKLRSGLSRTRDSAVRVSFRYGMSLRLLHFC